MKKFSARIADLWLDYVELRDALDEDSEAREIASDSVNLLNQLEFDLAVLKELLGETVG